MPSTKFSKPDAQVEEVFHAAEVANAHEFIARQPDGYEAMLGGRGVGLSGIEHDDLVCLAQRREAVRNHDGGSAADETLDSTLNLALGLAAKGKYYKLIQIQTMAEQAEAGRREEGFGD